METPRGHDVVWTAPFFVWWLLGIPLGPGAPVR
ncbi:AbgT family transporter [Streptomyces sp. NA02950]|nr:AbgT family transporter [Streptomyces sp. NA02950]